MSSEHNVSYLWEYIYMLGLTIMICLLPFLSFRLPNWLVLIIILAVAACIIIVWKRNLSKKLLLYNNILIVIAPLCLSYLLDIFLLKSVDSLVGVILAVAVMDVFSFTKSGKNTLNAKLMGNMNALARLSVCLPVPKKPGLQPIIGIGDLNYYSIIIMFFLISDGITAGFIASLTIFSGQLINIASILMIRKKPWYKGFPATLFPSILIFIAVLLRLIH